VIKMEDAVSWFCC